MSESSENQKSRPRKHKRRSIFFPLLLIAVGAVMIMSRAGLLYGDTWQILIRLWPLLLVIGGLDNLFNRRSVVSSVLSVGVGTLFLLFYMGYLIPLDINIWDIIRLWPVLLIAWGLDIIFARRSLLVAAVGFLVGLALVTGFAWLLMNPLDSGGTEVDSDQVSQPLRGVTSASLVISPLSGVVDISGGADASDLISGRLSLWQGETADTSYSTRGDKGIYELEGRGTYMFDRFVMVSQDFSRWNLKLNSEIPLELYLHLVAGEHNIDLTGLDVEELEVGTVFGRTVLRLPEEGDFRGDVETVFGELVILVPRGTPVRIRTEKGIAVLNVRGLHQVEGVITTPDIRGDAKPITLDASIVFGEITVQQLP